MYTQLDPLHTRESGHSGPTPATGGGLAMDNELTWSLTTSNVSPLKFGINNNSSIASMEDS